MNRKQASSTIAVLLTLLITAAATVPAEARDRDDRGPRGDRRERVFDSRYGHNQYYPGRGAPIPALPRDRYVARWQGSPYYFHGGVWYRPYGPRFLVVAPPIGIGIPFLPPYYTTVWFGGLPYYYADNTYYVWRPQQREYVVTEPPGDTATATTMAPGSDEPFVYPKNGQSSEQQATDRYECHRWAAEQTGFDPTQPLGGVDESEAAGRRADYQRAQGACLEGRGYTVR